MITKECIWCGELMIDRTARQIRKFCNPTCRTKWHYHNNPEVKRKMKANSLKQSKKTRENPALRLKQKIYFDKWRKINRIKYNKQMREVMRRRYKIKSENYRV